MGLGVGVGGVVVAFELNNNECSKAGIEAGDAAFVARKAGFQTVGATAKTPARWLCLSCFQKQSATSSP